MSRPRCSLEAVPPTTRGRTLHACEPDLLSPLFSPSPGLRPRSGKRRGRVRRGRSACGVRRAAELRPGRAARTPVPLRSGVGNSHEAVTTKSAEAQAFYDQGLNYLESYVWIEAARSFHQALRLDPKLAMAYLGLSSCLSGLDNPASRAAVPREGKSALVGRQRAGAPPHRDPREAARGHGRHRGRGRVPRLQEVDR